MRTSIASGSFEGCLFDVLTAPVGEGPCSRGHPLSRQEDPHRLRQVRGRPRQRLRPQVSRIQCRPEERRRAGPSHPRGQRGGDGPAGVRPGEGVLRKGRAGADVAPGQRGHIPGGVQDRAEVPDGRLLPADSVAGHRVGLLRGRDRAEGQLRSRQREGE